MKKLILMLSLVLCLASCDSKGSKDKDGSDYEITCNVSKDAKTIVNALLECAEDEDIDAINDLFGEVLDQYDDMYAAHRLMGAIGVRMDNLSRSDRETVSDFVRVLQKNRKECKNLHRFIDLAESTEYNSQGEADSAAMAQEYYNQGYYDYDYGYGYPVEAEVATEAPADDYYYGEYAEEAY